jgi:hypothetical protein
MHKVLPVMSLSDLCTQQIEILRQLQKTPIKSTFGNWLEEIQGYFHLDFDEEDIVVGHATGVTAHTVKPEP